MQGQWEGQCFVGVPRRELIYQPLQTEWTTPAHTPHTLTPHTLTPTPDQGLVEAEGEVDSGFQEAGGCIGLACAPLVSPERAREALMLGSSKQLVPMVGPQLTPVSDELSTTYKDKARQASEYISSYSNNNIIIMIKMIKFSNQNMGFYKVVYKEKEQIHIHSHLRIQCKNSKP